MYLKYFDKKQRKNPFIQFSAFVVIILETTRTDNLCTPEKPQRFPS